MLCCKYKQFIILLLFISSYPVLAEKFSAKECLDAKYKTEIVHKGKFFGLITNTLKIDKKACQLHVSYNNFLETIWKIDICREPIHLKVHSKGSETFYKRVAKCSGNSSISFCENLKSLKASIQDFGLIYAKGEREDITSAHGQTYCAHLLLDKYLVEGKLFSMYQEPHDLFLKKVKVDILPEKAPVATSPTNTIDLSPAPTKMNEPVVMEAPSEAPVESTEDKPRF